MNSSYKKIMKTTGIVGAVQIIQLVFGLVRNKLIAFFFGTTGLGIWTLYLSLVEMMQSVSSLGLEKSSVRQISQNQDDEYRKTLTIKVVQISICFFSVITSLFVMLFSKEFSINLFNSDEYTIGILVCAGVILLNSITNAYRSILNGLSEIRKLAISQLVGMLIGNMLVFLLIPFLDMSALPIYFLLIAVSSFAPTFLMVKKLNIKAIDLSLKDGFSSLSMLMKIGFAFWLSAVFMAFINYITNIYLKETLSISAVGMYQASWTISNLYIGIILSSMGVAFFPQICKIIEDNIKSSAAINQQIEFSLLISLPFIIVIYVFAPILLSLLYTSDFSEAASIIRWQILGVVIRLFGFPFGYALMAKGKPLQYMMAQFIFSSFNYIFMVLLIPMWGFDGLGLNYFIAYIFYLLITWGMCKKYLNYKVSSLLFKIVMYYFLFISISIFLVFYFDGVFSYVLGVGLVFLGAAYSHMTLKKHMDLNVFVYAKSFLDKLHGKY